MEREILEIYCERQMRMITDLIKRVLILESQLELKDRSMVGEKEIKTKENPKSKTKTTTSQFK